MLTPLEREQYSSRSHLSDNGADGGITRHIIPYPRKVRSSDVLPERQARRRIGANQGEAPLGEISDAVFRLDDPRGDLPALEVVFSAV